MKKFAALLFATLALLAAAATGSYWLTIRADSPLTPAMRAARPGLYASLPQGLVRYEWAGPQDGPVVVLVHGLSIPRFVFNRNVGALTQAGYRVLTYDHLGRGDSDRPAGPYDANFYDRELLDLLTALRVYTPVRLVGYSMGGGIAVTFAARHPERVAKLALVAPIGFMPKPGLGPRLLRTPHVGEWLMAVLAKRKLIAAVQHDADGGLFTQDMARYFAAQFADPGFRHALLSSMRAFLYSDLGVPYRVWGELKRPTLLLWGEADSTVPISGLAPARAAMPFAKVVTLPGAEHSLVYAQADAVNAALIDFLGHN